jgi:hypothetical protein
MPFQPDHMSAGQLAAVFISVRYSGHGIVMCSGPSGGYVNGLTDVGDLLRKSETHGAPGDLDAGGIVSAAVPFDPGQS